MPIKQNKEVHGRILKQLSKSECPNESAADRDIPEEIENTIH